MRETFRAAEPVKRTPEKVAAAESQVPNTAKQ